MTAFIKVAHFLSADPDECLIMESQCSNINQKDISRMNKEYTNSYNGQIIRIYVKDTSLVKTNVGPVKIVAISQ